jgi:hypothetical protein
MMILLSFKARDQCFLLYSRVKKTITTIKMRRQWAIPKKGSLGKVPMAIEVFNAYRIG